MDLLGAQNALQQPGNLLQIPVHKMSVYLGSGQALMAEQCLDNPQVSPSFKKMRCKAMAQCVRGDVLTDPCFSCCVFYCLLNASRVVAFSIPGEHKPCFCPKKLDQPFKLGVEKHNQVSGAFCNFQMNCFPFKINVLPGQIPCLIQPHAAVIQG